MIVWVADTATNEPPELWHGPFEFEHLPAEPAEDDDRFGDADDPMSSLPNL